jgi:hypothetical protein
MGSMANRLDARALCRGVYELTDGDLSKSLDVGAVLERLSLTQQEFRRAVSYAVQREWLAVEAGNVRLLEKGRALAEQPRPQRFKIWGQSSR